MEKIFAPFTEEQVNGLNQYQKVGIMHEFTCPKEHHTSIILVAHPDGWHCPECEYTQNWAWDFMSNPQALVDKWNASAMGKVSPIKIKS